MGDDCERMAVATDGTRIGFDVMGTGEALVLLPGQANARAWWGPIRSDFTGYTTIAIDPAGTSDVGDGDWSTRRFARDVISVLDKLGLDRAHVYGTSMGGRVASGSRPRRAQR